MKPTIAAWARAALVILALGTVLLQVLLPLQARETGILFPEVAHLVTPYSIAAVLAVFCVQVGLLALWMIVGSFARGTLYESSTLRWFGALRWSTVPATLIPSLVALHLLVVVGLGGPGVLLGFLATLATGAAMFILVTLTRRIYVTQAAEHAELEAVI